MPRYHGGGGVTSHVGASSKTSVTELLTDLTLGDAGALERVVPLVYDELRRVARAHLRREPAGHVLQTTELVQAAYLRLARLDRVTLFEPHAFSGAVGAPDAADPRRSRAPPTRRGGNLCFN